jgi:hypothetical protein
LFFLGVIMDMAKEDSDLDLLECVSIIMGESVWETFLKLCRAKGIGEARTEALWRAWITEDYLTNWMANALRFLLLKTLDHGLSSGAEVS